MASVSGNCSVLVFLLLILLTIIFYLIGLRFWLVFLAQHINGFPPIYLQGHSLTCGVPQGSIVGPLLFSFYMLTLARVIQSFSGIFFNHFYANDIQPYMSFKPYQLDRLSALVNSLSQISDWLANNSLVLNSDKTEAMIIAPPDIHLRTSQVIASFCSSAKTRVHNLFVVFDCPLSLDTHIKSISRSVLFHLRNISKL